MSVVDDLDNLIDGLNQGIEKSGQAPASKESVSGTQQPSGDALDVILGGAPRTTSVQSLRDSETVLKFRDDLLSGIVSLDRLSALLNLVSLVVAQVVRGRGI